MQTQDVVKNLHNCLKFSQPTFKHRKSLNRSLFTIFQISLLSQLNSQVYPVVIEKKLKWKVTPTKMWMTASNFLKHQK